VSLAAAGPETEVGGVISLLGGDTLFDQPIRTALEAHESIQRGFPSKSLIEFVSHFPSTLRGDALDKILGMSVRTFQRRKKASADERLSREQSGRLYKAAEIMAKAIDVFGSSSAAEDFLQKPAIALDRHRPIDLLSTLVGAELVERHLLRLDYGVYT
jgi:putative toxin-antitoxin system antitoxin component (TIGR02293 family)